MEARIDLSSDSLQKLREIAGKATRGEAFPKWADENDLINEDNEVPLIRQEDYSHILASNPETVSAMIDEIENLRAQCTRLEREADWLAKYLSTVNLETDYEYPPTGGYRQAARRAVERRWR